MKRVEKRKISKNLLQLVILGAMLVVLLGALLTVKLLSKNTSTGTTSSEPIDVREELGESSYANTPLAYGRIEEKYMEYILVRNRDEDGGLRMFELTSLDDGSFVLAYSKDGTVDTLTPYLPSIIGAEGDFDLSSLYAIEQNDSYGRIYMLTYLCTALGTPYFSERIELSEDETERQAMLERFGLDNKHASAVMFEYSDTDGTVNSHEVVIGARALSGSGFYFMVDDRDFVYYTNSNYFEYALRGFEDFVNGRLVAEGLSYDYSFEPYLTSDFKQWVNTRHELDGEIVTSGSTVIAKGTAALPLTAGSDYTPEGDFDGYVLTEEILTFSPDALSDHTDYARFIKMLEGKAVGEYADTLYLTLIDELGSSSGGLISFDGKESVTYSYTIKAIESVITATDEIRTKDGLTDGEGNPVSYNLIKVTYDYSVDGVKQNEYDAHAVLDLSSSLLPAELVSRLREAGVGEVNESFDITYTEENAPCATERLYVSAITAIYSQSGELLSTVTDTSFVTFAYYEVINGHKTSTRTVTIDLSANDTSERWGELRAKLVGKTLGGDLDIKLYEKTYRYELMRGFIEYRVDDVMEFITSELVVAFRYVNKLEQDPFYGESVYENTMDELGYDKYTIYGIDSTVCQSVLKVLGGIADSSGSSTSVGYTGETVALGLTHDVMDEYGLYANTVYFELPRGIYDPEDVNPSPENNTSSDDLSDLSSYAWYDTLGFTLYVSDAKDGYRYVGSDMYDLVARVPAEDFSFLDYSFTELWARNNFLFMDVNNVKELNFDFSMKDYYGKYGFSVTKEPWYVGSTETGGMASPNPFDGATTTTRLYVDITSSDDAKYTEYERIKDEKGLDSLSASAIYSELYNGGKDYFAGSIDTYGIVNYKGLFEKLLRTSYQDRLLTDEEVSAALSRQRLMRMTVKVFETDGSVRPGYYAYDFYYVDGSRVMVAAFKTDNSGRVTTEKVCDFTISNYAFENIVLSVFGILNGETLDDNEGYIDKK